MLFGHMIKWTGREESIEQMQAALPYTVSALDMRPYRNNQQKSSL